MRPAHSDAAKGDLAMESFPVHSQQKNEMIDITKQIQDCLQRSGVKDGLCSVFVPHTTAAVTVNENTDPDVRRDMLLGLTRMIPKEDYKHFEHNSPAHMLSSLVGCSQTLLIQNGSLVLGTWQAVYFCEFDGPRQRQVQLQVVEENKR